jgi:ADP-heptose:LPS heptosyltransferase
MTAKLLAVCSGGGIGDLLAATPAIKAWCRHMEAPATVMASHYAAPVLQDQPWLTEVIVDDGSARERELAQRLRERSFTHAIVFWSTARVAGAIRRADIPVRIGQARRLYSWQYTTRVPVRTESGDETTHWTDVQMDYARAAGATPVPGDYAIDVRLRAENRLEAQRVLGAAGITDPFVVLHAARGIDLDRVAWPTAHFACIGDALATAFGMPVVLTGSSADARAIDAIAGAMQAKHADVAGRTSLMGLAALLARSSMTVALDSGPMHIAAALGVPTVGIFALRTDLPDRWRPLGPRTAIVRPSYPCPPWHRKETCRSFACYANLSPASIIDAAASLPARSSAPVTAPRP